MLYEWPRQLGQSKLPKKKHSLSIVKSAYICISVFLVHILWQCLKGWVKEQEEDCQLQTAYQVLQPKLQSLLTVWPSGWSKLRNPYIPTAWPSAIARLTSMVSDLAICKHWKEYGHARHPMSLLKPGVIKQHKISKLKPHCERIWASERCSQQRKPFKRGAPFLLYLPCVGYYDLKGNHDSIMAVFVKWC